MNPKIISIGWATPERSYTQEQALEMLGYKSPSVRSIFANSGISQRYLWIDPVGKTWQELCDAYKEGALVLSKEAILNCLDGRSLDDIGCFIYGSCTGYTCPGMSHVLAKELNMPKTLMHSNFLGMGCEAGGPALARAVDHVVAHGTPALLVNCELCSCAYYPAPESDLENIIVNCLFGDAAAAVYVGYDDISYHPEIVDVQSYFDAKYIDYLGFKWVDGRLKCVLDKDVPRASSMLIKEAVLRLLEKHKLKVGDITHWAIHPGGVRVIENVQRSLGLSDEQVEPSYNVLREFGNVSSATIIILGKQLNRVVPPALAVAVTMGAGFECSTALLRWR